MHSVKVEVNALNVFLDEHALSTALSNMPMTMMDQVNVLKSAQLAFHTEVMRIRQDITILTVNTVPHLYVKTAHRVLQELSATNVDQLVVFSIWLLAKTVLKNVLVDSMRLMVFVKNANQD